MSEVPELVDGVAVSESSDPDGRHAVFVPPDRALRVSSLAAGLLRRIDGRTGLSTLATQLHDEHSHEVAPEELRRLLEQTLVPAGIVRFGPAESNGEPARAKSPALIPEGAVDNLARALSPAFGWLGLPLVALSLASLVLVIAGPLAAPAGRVHWSAWLGSLLLAMLLQLAHELGHAAAMRRHGIRPGAIGLARRGGWLVSPYTDAARACLLPSSQRLSVYAGGAYFQLLLAGAVVAAFPLLPSSNRFGVVGILLAGVLLAEALSSLAPKEEGNDGSWLLHDLPQRARLPFVVAWLAAAGAWLAWMVVALGPSIGETLEAGWRGATEGQGRGAAVLTLLLVGYYLFGLVRSSGSVLAAVGQLVRLLRSGSGRKGA